MEKSNIYEEAIYDSIDRLVGNYNSPYQVKELIRSLIDTEHSQLIVGLCVSGKLRYPIISCCIECFLQRGQLDSVNIIIQSIEDISISKEVLEAVDIEKCNPSELNIFCDLVLKQNENPGKILFYIIKKLWEIGQFDVAEELSEKYVKNEDLIIFRSLGLLLAGNIPSHKDIEVFAQNIEKRKKRYDLWGPESKDMGTLYLKSYFNLNKNVEDLVVISVLFKKYSIDRLENIDNFIDRHYLESKEYDKLESFLRDTGKFTYREEGLNDLRLKKALEANDKGLHESVLEKRQAAQGLKIQELKSNLERKKDDRDDIYRYRSENEMELHLEKSLAMEYCDQAVYEVLHGTESLNAIQAMIRFVEGLLSDNKVEIKELCRRCFFNAGIVHYLPGENGWNAERKHTEFIVNKRKQQDAIDLERVRKTKNDESIKKEREKYTQSLLLLLNKGDRKGVLDFFESLVNKFYYTNESWEFGMLILNYFPDLFDTLFAIIEPHFFNKKEYNPEYMGEEEGRSFAQFITRGLELRAVSPGFIKGFLEYITKPQYKGYGEWVCFPSWVIEPIAKYLSEIGDRNNLHYLYQLIKDNRYEGEQNSYSTEENVLGAIIASITTKEGREGVRLALEKSDIEKESISESEKLAHWEARINMSVLNGDIGEYKKNAGSMRGLLQSSDNPQWLIRAWCKKVLTYSKRSPHQIKDEMSSILESNLAESDIIRRRIVHTILSLKIPGSNALNDFKSNDNTNRMQRFWFRKLIESEFITKSTETLLQGAWESHITPLRKLLAQYQNQFDTVVDSLVRDLKEQKEEILRMYREEGRKVTFADIPSIEWKNVFIVLDILGMITPGILAQAQEDGFDKDELKGLEKRIKEEKKELFKNNILNDDISDVLQAEVIYQAFSPVGMSLSGVRRMLGEIPDCSHHLDKYTFPEDGYAIDVQGKKEVRMRNGAVRNNELDAFRIETEKDKEEIQFFGRALCETGRLKFEMFDEDPCKFISYLFKDDRVFQDLISELLKKIGNDSREYAYILKINNFLSAYLQDNLAIKIQWFFKTNSSYISGMWESLHKSLQIPKRQNVIKKQLSIDYSFDFNEENLSHVLAEAILQKSKGLKDFKKLVNTERKKYVSIDGENLRDTNMILKAYISKNKASFFAKASAGLCTSDDIESFIQEDLLHINIIDNQKQVCLGNLMAYEMDHTGEKILLLRGFNPNKKILKEIDIPSYCDAMINIAEQFVRENNFDAVYMCEQTSNFYALSNNEQIRSYLMSKYGKNPKSIEQVIAYDRNAKSRSIAKKMYPIKQIKEAVKAEEKPVEEAKAE